MGEQLLARGEIADSDGLDAVWVLLGCVAVRERVVLAVVADENPLHLRERNEQVAQLDALVFLAAAEQASGRGPPVREQHGAFGQAIVLQESLEGIEGVPGTGGQVDDGRVGVVFA